MISKEQYNVLNSHRDMLELFKRTGEPLGDLNPLYDLHKQVTGETRIAGCAGCSGRILIDCYNMLKRYEK